MEKLVSRDWTEFEDEYLRREYTEGRSNRKEIAKVLGRSESSVKSRLTRLGIRWRSAIEIPEGHHFCTKCRGVYPSTEFADSNTRPSGKNVYCKTCVIKQREDALARRIKNRKPVSEIKCRVCGVTKPVSEYWKDRQSTTGYHTQCRDCAMSQEKVRRERRKNALITKEVQDGKSV